MSMGDKKEAMKRAVHADAAQLLSAPERSCYGSFWAPSIEVAAFTDAAFCVRLGRIHRANLPLRKTWTVAWPSAPRRGPKAGPEGSSEQHQFPPRPPVITPV